MSFNKSNKSNFTKARFFVFLFLCTLNLLAQSDTIYVDENDRYVSKAIFFKKAKSKIYKGVEFSTDTVVLRKLRFNYYFGKLRPIVKSQLFKILNQRHKIDTSKTLVIRYADTLRAKGEYPIVQNKNVFNNRGGSYKSFISSNKKLERYYKTYKKKLILLRFFYHNNGHSEIHEEMRWYKDYGGVIKKVFSHLDGHLQSLIIHPDGEFYIESMETVLPFTDLFLKKDWFDYKNEFAKRVKELNNL